MARISDGSILKLNKDKKTYSFMSSKSEISNKYDFERLNNPYFTDITKRDFPRMKRIHDEYYEFLSWANRSDGHGGIKGGTIEEYRELKRNNEFRRS